MVGTTKSQWIEPIDEDTMPIPRTIHAVINTYSYRYSCGKLERLSNDETGLGIMFQNGLHEFIYAPLNALIDYATATFDMKTVNSYIYVQTPNTNIQNQIINRSICEGLQRFKCMIAHKTDSDVEELYKTANTIRRFVPKLTPTEDPLFDKTVRLLMKLNTPPPKNQNNSNQNSNLNSIYSYTYKKSLLLRKMSLYPITARNDALFYEIERVILREIYIVKKLMSQLTTECISALNNQVVYVTISGQYMLTKKEINDMTSRIGRMIANYYGNLNSKTFPLESLLLNPEYSINKYITDVDNVYVCRRPTNTNTCTHTNTHTKEKKKGISFLEDGMYNLSRMIRYMIDPK